MGPQEVPLRADRNSRVRAAGLMAARVQDMVGRQDHSQQLARPERAPAPGLYEQDEKGGVCGIEEAEAEGQWI